MPKLLPRLAAFTALVAVTGGALTLGLTRAPAAVKGAAAARGELAQSLGLFKVGNFSAARLHAMKAIKADPSWGLAHAVLARDFLALGDGVGAEAELDRAKDAGFDMGQTHQLMAHAQFLQGDYDAALDEAALTAPRYGGYALRIVARVQAAQDDVPGAEATLAHLLAANPHNAAAWVDLGRIRYEAGDVGGAIDAAGRAIALAPANLDALVLRGELVRTQYGLLPALPWFETALQRDAYFHPALIEYASTLGDVGRNEDMLSATRKALAVRPDSPQAFYLLAVLAARAGKYDLARAMMAKTNGALDDLPGAMLLDGTIDYAGGAYAQAISEWRALVDVQPMNITARRLLGTALLRSGDAKGALDVLRPVALRGDADSYTLLLVARAFERTGERDWAAKYLDRAAFPASDRTIAFGTDDNPADLARDAATHPGDPVAAVGMIRGLLEKNDQAGALAAAQKIAALQPGAPAGHLLVGDVLMAGQKWNDAVEAYRGAADLRFDQPTMLRLVEALDRGGRSAEAASVLGTYLSQNPQDVTARRLAAHWQLAAGRWDDASDTLEGVRDVIGTRDAAVLTELAETNGSGGDPVTAQAYAAAAYRLAPMNPAATDAYGWALFGAGQNGQAAELLQKAVALAPEHAMIRWHYAQALAKLNRAADAKAQIAAALSDPSFVERVPAAMLLKKLG